MKTCSGYSEVLQWGISMSIHNKCLEQHCNKIYVLNCRAKLLIILFPHAHPLFEKENEYITWCFWRRFLSCSIFCFFSSISVDLASRNVCLLLRLYALKLRAVSKVVSLLMQATTSLRNYVKEMCNYLFAHVIIHHKKHRQIICNKCSYFVLRFYGPVNPMGSCRARSVYLTTHLLGRLSPLSG